MIQAQTASQRIAEVIRNAGEVPLGKFTMSPNWNVARDVQNFLRRLREAQEATRAHRIQFFG